MKNQAKNQPENILEEIYHMKVFKSSIDGESDLVLERNTFDGRQCPSSVCHCSRQEQAEQEAYRDKRHDGQLYIPRTALLGLLIQASSQRGLRVEWNIKRYVRIVEPHILLTHAFSEVPITDYAIHSESFTRPSSGKIVLRHRPRLRDWGAMFRLCYNEKYVSPALIRGLLVEVGKQIGLGACTERGNGAYGRFTVTEWQEIM